MRKLTYTAFVAFWATIATLLLLRVMVEAELADAPAKAAESAIGSAVPPTDPIEQSDATPKYRLDEISLHDRLEDCWMVIEGQVHDLSAYVPRHPAADEVLEIWCGRDATEGMRTKDRGRDHSARAWRMLDRYRIGALALDDTETAGD